MIDIYSLGNAVVKYLCLIKRERESLRMVRKDQ